MTPHGMNGELSFRDNFTDALSGSPIPELEPPTRRAPGAPRSNGCECRVIGVATARVGTLAITVNGEGTIGVIVDVDLERGVPASNNPEKRNGR
jgi:hypothetical protein